MGTRMPTCTGDSEDLLAEPEGQTGADEGARVPAVAMSNDERVIRGLNVLVALIGLVLTLPIWLLIALAIKLTSRGPVFYAQSRVGLDARQRRPPRHDSRRRADMGGRPFVIYKFRTMTVDAERHGKAVWATNDDQRVTRIGGWLRSCRLDELPQLINVLRGEMSLVGPRPIPTWVYEQIDEPSFHRRFSVMPGMTGMWQVHGRPQHYRLMAGHDLRYVDEWSLWLDLKILLKTIPAVIRRQGAH